MIQGSYGIPREVEGGWTFFQSRLPAPSDPAKMWRVISRIMDCRDGGVLVLAHHNADIDAVGAAVILKRTFPWVMLGAYKSISQAGRSLLDHVKVQMEVDPDVMDHSLVVIIDSSSPLQISEGDISGWPEICVIDHHAERDHWKGTVYSDSSAGACVEIALQMAFMSGASMDRDMAVAGIAGIIADTGKFRFASEIDIAACGFLLEGSDVSMENVLQVIEGEEYFDVSKKVAMLKAMRRIRYEKVGDQIVATSMVSSFEAAAARALLVAGGDVVFIAAERRDELRVSTRAKPHILAMGVHLGKFMEAIGKDTGNQGGGHDGAAGLNGSGDASKVLELCMDRMCDILAEQQGVKRQRPPDPRGRSGGRGGRR
ncbi:MAG: DHH family phosphoesterase [Thermoplasmatota archaeon]